LTNDPSDEAGPRPVDRIDVALFGLIVLLYAGGWIAAEYALREIAPLSLAATRFLIAGTILTLFALATRRSLGLDRPGTIVALAFFGIATGHALIYTGLRMAPATDGAVVSTVLGPTLSFLFAVTALRERMSWRAAVGAGIGIAGVLLVVAAPREVVGEDVLLGDLLLMLGAASQAAYTILGRVAMRGGSAIGVAGTSTFLAGAMMLPFALAFEPPIDPATWSEGTWLAYGYLTIPSAVFAASIYYSFVRRSGAVRATLVQYVTPVAVFALSAVLLGEAPTPLRIAGALLAIVGTRLVLTDRRTGIAELVA
jgi:drug/metabolite transporter (DMT)-like permease